MKGLPRSLANTPLADRMVVKERIAINKSVDITGVAATVDAATFVIGQLPAGNLLLLGAVAQIAVAGETPGTNIIDDWDGDFGIGTAPQADVDLGDAGDDNIIPSTALASAADDKDAPNTRGASTATEQVIINNEAGAMELNFNLLIDDNVITDDEDGTFVVTGSLDIAYIVLGQ